MKKFAYSGRLYYHYLRRTGLFSYLAGHSKKLLMLILIFVSVFFLIEKFIISTKEIFDIIIDNVASEFVFALFFISETILGLIPPDLFIMWGKGLGVSWEVNPWAIVGLLATLSYLGGVSAYFIGRWLSGIDKINYFVNKKYEDLFSNLKKWGGFFVVIAALLPLPFSLITMMAGMTKFPIKPLVTLGLFRFLRFFLYAIFLFMLV